MIIKYINVWQAQKHETIPDDIYLALVLIIPQK